MSGWSNITSVAKTALFTAQKKIDNVLDIHEDNPNSDSSPKPSSSAAGLNRLKDDFFSAFGLQNATEQIDAPSESSRKSAKPWASWFNNIEADSTSSKIENDPSQPVDKIDTPPSLVIDEATSHDMFDSFVNSNHPFSTDDADLLSPSSDEVPVVSTSSQLTLIDPEATFEAFTADENRPSSAKTLLDSSAEETRLSAFFESFDELNASGSPADQELRREVYLCIDHILESVTEANDCTTTNVISEQLAKVSGYSSPFDDMETNASSDIEIMSTPNGDYGSESSCRSISISRGMIDFSVLATSFLPDRHQRTELKGTTSSSSRKTSLDIATAEQKIEQMSKILEMREKRLMDVSSENVKLSIENEQLRREIRQDKQQHGQRFSQEKELSVVQRDKRRLEQRVECLERELGTRISMQQFQQVVTDKDRQISELMKEGEKLAIKELKCNNLVKKLREIDAENVKTIKQQAEKLTEMDNLKKKLKANEEQELKYDGTVIELRSIVEKQEKSVDKLRKELEDSEEKATGYKNAMNNLNNENADLQRLIAELKKEIGVMKISSDQSRETDLQQMLDHTRKESESQKQRHVLELESIKCQLGDAADEFRQREASYRSDLKLLEMRLQEAEIRNQQLVDSAANATKPLLHQIESLRNSVQNQQTNFERIEQSLFDKLVLAERECAVWKEKEQTIKIGFEQYRLTCSKTDTDLACLRAENSKQHIRLVGLQRELDEMRINRDKILAELEKESMLRLKLTEDLQKEKEIIVSQFEFEKNQLKTLHEQNLLTLNEKIAEQENVIKTLRDELVDVKRAPSQSAQPVSPRISESSMFDADDTTVQIPSGSYATVLEHLRSKLQERERDVWIIKDELRHMQMSRDALTASFILVNGEKASLEEWIELNRSSCEELEKLKRNYDALLQMYGEKVEENDELRLDLIDVKAMYKQHIEEFVDQTASGKP